MPNSQTMRRAISVTRSRSFCAPVQTSLNTISLGGAATQQRLSCRRAFAICCQEMVFGRQSQNVAQSAMPRGKIVILCGGSVLRQQFAEQCVADFVISNDGFFSFLNDAAFALRPSDDALDGFFEFRLADLLLVAPRGQKRGFVDEVRQIGAGKTGGALGDNFEVHVGRQRLAFDVNVQNFAGGLWNRGCPR